jgi:predicted transposase YbfD/YdcC
MNALLPIFADIDDPRDFNARHDLSAMLFIALAATLCGAKSCVDIADFAAVNAAELAGLVDLPHGTPSHDSFSRLFRLLDPQQLEAALCRFAQAMRAGLGLGAPSGVVSLDGKRVRRGYERGRASMPPLLVGIWDGETRLSLAACGRADGNEVAAALEALKMVSLKGCIVTADALHCHPAAAQQIRDQGGHYLLKLKGNHGPLFKAAEHAFAAADAAGKLRSHAVEDADHGRIERREGSVLAIPADTPAFPDLVAFGRVIAERQDRGGKTARKVHCAVLSRRMSAERMMTVNRQHWGIENNLHWQLDVVFREDEARTRKGYGAQNLSVIRRMALDILRAHPDNRSIARKMQLATRSKEFFYELSDLQNSGAQVRNVRAHRATAGRILDRFAIFVYCCPYASDFHPSGSAGSRLAL